MILTLIIPILLGILAGYLVNYLADVLPADLQLTHPLCKNPDCRARIPWADYFLLRRCRKCNKAPSSRVYLVLMVTLVFTIYMWLFPPTRMGFWLGIIVFIYLFLVALIDFETRYVLRPVSLVGLIICLGAGLLMRTWQETLLGAAAGFGIMFFLYILGILFSRWRKKRLAVQDNEEALGSGDITLAILLGLLLGWPLILFNLLAGILLAGAFSILILIAVLISKKYRPLMMFISFGPFLIVMAFILMYFPQWISALLNSG